jgi:sulfur-oxidizing protein SoxB
MTYACDPLAKIGQRISDMRLAGRPMQAGERYKVAGWAPVAEGAAGEPVWDAVTRYLRNLKTVAPRVPNLPRLAGIEAGSRRNA